MKAGSFISLLMIFALIGSGQPLAAQVGSPSPMKPSILTGRVFDRNGAVVVGSEVSLIGDRGTRFGTLTNDEGIYLVDLPAGFYSLQIRAHGFSTFSFECYQIPSEGRVNFDVTLQVSGEPACVSGLEKDISKPSPRGEK